jgi:transposase
LLIAGLRLDGLVAPFVFDGPINAVTFQPTSSSFSRARTQAWRHRGYGQPVQPQATEGRRADRCRRASLLYLPQYSPDFNPIEKLFAKFKALLR